MAQNLPKITLNGQKWRPDLRTFSAIFLTEKANFFTFRMYDRHVGRQGGRHSVGYSDPKFFGLKLLPSGLRIFVSLFLFIHFIIFTHPSPQECPCRRR